MADARVVDTNVLIVASAADSTSPFKPEATPVQEAALRQRVLDWMIAFEKDASRHAVFDWDWHLCDEYSKKLGQQDYGWLAMMSKHDRRQVQWVGIEVDEHHHAVLPRALSKAVTDLDDRKMIAAVLAARSDGHDCHLVNACDTDWLDCHVALKDAGIAVEQLLDDWLQAKWASKRSRNRPRER